MLQTLKIFTMRKNLLFVIAMLFATGLSAQLYVGAKLGYGFGAQKTAFGSTMTATSDANIYASMGQGIPVGLKVGYFFNDNLGVELGMNYFLGAEQTMADVTMTGYTNNATAKSNQIRLLPALVYKTDMGLYGRFGMVVPVGGSTVVKSTEVMGATTTETELLAKGSMSFGFVGSLGYEFELSDNLKLFGELEYVGLSIKSKSLEMTSYKVNGTDQLAAVPEYNKMTNYVDELTSSSNNSSYNQNVDPTKAKDDLADYSGYSAFRINFGVSFYFN